MANGVNINTIARWMITLHGDRAYGWALEHELANARSRSPHLVRHWAKVKAEIKRLTKEAT